MINISGDSGDDEGRLGQKKGTQSTNGVAATLLGQKHVGDWKPSQRSMGFLNKMNDECAIARAREIAMASL